MGIFEDNLRRAKDELSRNYGGEHGRKDHNLLGAHPKSPPVFFVD